MENETKPSDVVSPVESQKDASMNTPSIPAAIIVAGLLVALAIIYSSSEKGVLKNIPKEITPTKGQVPARGGSNGAINPADITIRALSPQDHILGDPQAPVKIISYSDFECPFCKRFHKTLQGILKTYQGKVALVYRHFPLDALHKKARQEAAAAECANALGGHEKFWAYVDRIFEITPSNDGLESSELPRIAQFVGLDEKSFSTCLSSDQYAAHIEEDVQDAIQAGGRGTPYSVVISRSGKKFPVSGALPIEDITPILDRALTD